jgi:hypothetical protein
VVVLSERLRASNVLISIFCLFQTLVHAFARRKDLHSVETMLYAAALPILWRALEMHNNDCRANAALLFFALYPFRDPNAKTAERADEAIRQHSLITVRVLVNRRKTKLHDFTVASTRRRRPRARTGNNRRAARARRSMDGAAGFVYENNTRYNLYTPVL